MFTEEEIHQLQLAVVQRIHKLEKSLEIMEPDDAAYDSFTSSLEQSKLAYKKLLQM